MRITKKKKQALRAANYDLFTVPTRIRPGVKSKPAYPAILPDQETLQGMYHILNNRYFKGKLPRVRIEWSTRMRAAGKYYVGYKLIRLGRKYHEYYPEEVEDTLKHEMIHILYPDHGKKFKQMASLLGTSFHAKDYPGGRSPHKYIYVCPVCGQKYFRHRRMSVSSCGRCSNGKYDPRFKLRLFWSAKKGRRKN
jgi:SprT-like protein